MDIINKEGTSEVKFITNDKLKIFINEIQTIFKAELEETLNAQEGRNFEEILAIQYTIRQYIIKNQHRIDFFSNIHLAEGDAKSMPSLFGLYMMCVSKIEHIHNILDVMGQVEKRYICHMGVKQYCGIDASAVVFQTDDIGNKKVCCCSHKCMLNNMAIIKNSITNYHVVIGCDCINKNNLIDKDVIKNAIEKTEKYLIKKIATDKIKEDKNKIKADKKKDKDKIKADRDEIKRLAAERKIKYNYRYYIKVKYEEKEEAKEYGAKWDAQNKLWYIPPNCRNTFILKQKYDK